MNDLDDVVRRALAEDLGPAGDVTSVAVVPAGTRCAGRVVARTQGIIAGLGPFARTFGLVDPSVEVSLLLKDGDRVEPGKTVAEVRGAARSILASERVALNFLGHLSGVATLTRAHVDAGARVLHTRKTLPGMRALQRAAVEAGGGRLHRGSLSDGILIKDNHVALAGGVGEAVRRARADAPHGLPVQVEVESLGQLDEALDAGADAILLDNADLETVKRAVEVIAGRVPLEVSGGIRLEQVADLAAAGDLLISVGRLTHSAPALDVSLEIEPER